MLQRFPQESPFNSIKCFFEVDEQEWSRNIFQVGLGNNIINQTNTLWNRTAFQKTGLIVIYKIRQHKLETRSDRFWCNFVIVVK